ncbi:hypothetical protein A4H97_08370 [Niastella yeongjuensis]|uniref:DUF6249 domain-containing protein n=1 Tax=Niastella yeongjuensis TaxID=354355 RepID=A0A1V9ENP6_9BACT|nr:DUF6249 domain-containing protein [Niastella yeongjuensis]OQP47495.1 hypothetical protein A4H97_08370 [Niastella yeongjuensis]SEN86756.1 hypothetical protein SAMN05660816_01701 [Niastella yeongjuensis]
MVQEIFYIWLTIIICVFLAWYFRHKDGHKERMKLIEQGINPMEKTTAERKENLMRIAIVVVGISIGSIIISILVGLKLLNHLGNVFPLAILGLCGGISLIIANLSKRNRDKQ